MTVKKQRDLKTGAAKSAPKNRAAEISSARKAAFQILLAVERGHSHSDDLLRGKAVNSLSPADRNLATALVLGVLRWQIRLDGRIHALLARPNSKLDAEIRIVLRLGAFQILQMDRIPARAAIDESVELAKQAGHRYASGMVNAVLRKVAAASPLQLQEDNAVGLALAQAHPAWMVERWVSFYGLDATRAICRHGQCQPVQTVRITDISVEEELRTTGVVFLSGELLTAARVAVSGDVTAALLDGRLRLQDEGSQLVAELACASANQNVKSVLDCCAAPGGKTLILAERNPQAQIVACESSAPRLEQLRKRLAHLSERVEFRLADATALTEEAAFDLALADVPCSGTGTLGRNPEIRHRLRLDDLPRQAERQRAILAGAIRALRPGGGVVYSTCSLEPEENEQVVSAVLTENPNARLISLEASISKLLGKEILTDKGAERLRGSLTPEGFLRLLPGAFHTDGFFVALIEKVM
jgi:16S rRNA (cytosine967-C5)-methyltransferase